MRGLSDHPNLVAGPVGPACDADPAAAGKRSAASSGAHRLSSSGSTAVGRGRPGRSPPAGLPLGAPWRIRSTNLRTSISLYLPGRDFPLLRMGTSELVSDRRRARGRSNNGALFRGTPGSFPLLRLDLKRGSCRQMDLSRLRRRVAAWLGDFESFEGRLGGGPAREAARLHVRSVRQSRQYRLGGPLLEDLARSRIVRSRARRRRDRRRAQGVMVEDFTSVH